MKAGYLPERLDAHANSWFAIVLALLVPSVDKLEDLPARAQLIFRYDAKAALASPDSTATTTTSLP